MTLADDLMATVYEGRGIAGTLGFRPHRVFLLTDFFSASGDATPLGGTSRVEIVEGGGQPPKVRRKQGDSVGFGNAMENTYEIGPITPAFAGGGTDLQDLVGALNRGEVRHLLIVGPYTTEDGVRLRILDVNADKPLRYVISAQAEGEALKGI